MTFERTTPAATDPLATERQSVSMFAAWIPEALAEIEALAKIQHPPSYFAVRKAREIIVNRPAHIPMPIISSWGDPKTGGIAIRWESKGDCIDANGTHFSFQST